MGMLQSHLSSANTETITATTTVNHATSTDVLVPSSVDSYEWLIDSGAPRHVCYCSELFHNMRRTYGIYVVLPTLFHVDVEYMSDIWLSKDFLLHMCCLEVFF